MKVENVARVSFASRWAAKKQGHLAIRHSLLGQIIIDDQSVAAIVAEILGHSCRSVWCKVLHRCRLGSRRSNDDRIINRASFFQLFNKLCNCRALLPDRNIYTVKLFAFVIASSVVVRFLVQDRIKRHGCFTCLAVTNNQLTLATANRDQGVNGFDTSRHRLVNRFTGHNARRFNVCNTACFGFDRAFAVDRVTQTVNYTTKKRITRRNVHNGLRTFNCVAFFNVTV